MKHIVKGREPAELRNWRLANKSTPQNLRYVNIPANALKEIREFLLKEQGYLCAYTMLRIGESRRGHIEHIIAQSRDEERQIQFSNMIYCYPGENEPRCAFGAHAKDGQDITSENFISPLNPTCESRFLYTKDGAVDAARANDDVALRTLAVLNLDSPALQRARRAAIRRLSIFNRSGLRVPARQARKEVTNLLAKDGEGRFREFAVVLAQIMTTYARKKTAQEAAMAGR